MNDDTGQWFVYSRSAGRITAAPANWKGWFTLVVGVSLISVGGNAAMFFTRDLHYAIRLGVLSAVILVGVWAIVRIAIRKGRLAS